MFMKKLVEHGKIWLIAAVISFGSFFYMQLDSQQIAQKQANIEISSLEMIDDEDKEFENAFIELDLVKDLTSFFVDLIKLSL